MKKMMALALFVYLVSAGALLVQSANEPCSVVLEYSIGSYDPRFGIPKDQFTKIVQEMESVWEQPIGRDFFNYDPNAEFKVNLIFDERQQKTNDEKELRQKIDLSEGSYDKLIAQYNAISYQHKEQLSAYESANADFQARLAEYNEDVAFWNERGGAPKDEYQRLNDEKKSLDQENKALNSQRESVNQLVLDLNALSERIDEVAKTLNKDVDLYNGKFGSARRFDQGTYDGKSINIYQFNEESDLRLVVAHEFGHAIGLEHIDDPEAIMHYLMDQQNLANIKATVSDLAALKTICKM